MLPAANLLLPSPDGPSQEGAPRVPFCSSPLDGPSRRRVGAKRRFLLVSDDSSTRSASQESDLGCQPLPQTGPEDVPTPERPALAGEKQGHPLTLNDPTGKGEDGSAERGPAGVGKRAHGQENSNKIAAVSKRLKLLDSSVAKHPATSSPSFG
jgi:hypothetical protein